MKMTRRSGFCRMKAWRSAWMRGTTMWLPFTRRTLAGSFVLSTSSSTCLTQGPAAFTIAAACTVRLSPESSASFATQRPFSRFPDPAVVVDEAALELGLQARAVAVGVQADALRARQRALRSEPGHAVPQVIVEKQPGADQPRGPQVRLVRQHELERPDDVGRDAEQRLALGERFGDEAELEVLQVPQAAVDQLGRGRRGRRGEVALLDQEHLQAAAGGVARDTRAVDAAADDQEIVVLVVHVGGFPPPRPLDSTRVGRSR